MVAIIRNAPTDRLKASQPIRKATKPTFRTFTNDDLPPGSRLRFFQNFVPLFRDFFGTLANPWDTTQPGIVEEMQVIWEMVFPDIGHLVAIRGDAVYHLVRFLLTHDGVLTCHIIGDAADV